MSTFPYGTVLKLDRGRKIEEIVADLEAIRAVGMNTVVLWPAAYWWEEPAGDFYPFATGRTILSHAERIGLQVIVELIGQIPTLEYAPHFLLKEGHLAVNRDGSYRRLARPYDFINFNHPEVRDLIRDYLRGAAAAYRELPALAGYDIWNETMFTSFDRFTLALFRDWLADKYGSVEGLNDSWESTYRVWEEVEFTEWSWASVMPVVDYNQFRKANIGMLLHEWRSWLAEVDPAHPCIADNIHSMITADGHYERPQDDWAVAGQVDHFGISFYPKNHLPEMPPSERWEIFSAVRAAGPQGEFWVSEMQSHNQSLFNPFNGVLPHDLRWWNWEAVSQGAKGIVYWKWRPFRQGVQTYARGLVDAAGRATERSAEAGRIAALLTERSYFFSHARPEPARAAILYDPLSHDFAKAFLGTYSPLLSGSLYTDSIAGLYRALWDCNVAVDFVRPEEAELLDPRVCRVLFASNQLVMSGRLARALEAYTVAGGVLVCDGKLGLIDERGHLHDELPGGPLNSLLGYRVVDTAPDGLGIRLDDGALGSLSLDGYHERQSLELGEGGSEAIAGFVNGDPALVRSTAGQGEIISIATSLWLGYFAGGAAPTRELAERFVRRFELRLEESADERLKTRRLVGPEGVVFFVFNYETEEIVSTVRLFGLPWKGGRVRRLDREGEGESVPVGREGIVSVAVEARSVGLYELVPERT